MADKILIKNASAIVTCDADDNIFSNCDLLVNGPEIKEIGPNLMADDATLINAENCFVYPGLINTHHHFFQAFVRNLITIDLIKMSVLEWIRNIYEIFKRIDAECIYYSSLTAMADLIKHGCTTAFDHQYCFPRHAGKELVDLQFEAAEQLGIRYHAGRGANTLPMSEGSTVPDEMVETTDEFLQDCDRLISAFHDSSRFSTRQVVVSPCQPINCYKETFSESLALARDKGVRLHTHLGEGEDPGMVERYGMRSLPWCEEIGFVGEDIWYAHGWDLLPDEYTLMGSTRTGLSHCPVPAFLGGFNTIDIPAMQKEGMRISLGVDGSATNDGSNLLEAVRVGFLMQSAQGKSRGVSPTPYELLKICVNGGADILGRPDLGSLEKGKGADLFMIDVHRMEYAGAVHDPANLIGRVGVTDAVDLTMINGKVVYQQGHFPGIDQRDLFEKAEKVCDRIIRKDNPAYEELNIG